MSTNAHALRCSWLASLRWLLMSKALVLKSAVLTLCVLLLTPVSPQNSSAQQQPNSENYKDYKNYEISEEEDSSASTSTTSERDRSHDPCVALLLPFSDRGDLSKISGQLAEVAEFSARGAYLRLKLVDTGVGEEKLLDALKSAYQDPCVIAAIGPLGQKSSRRLATSLRKYPLPTFSLLADETIDGLSPYLHRMRHDPREYARAIAREAYSNRHVRRVAILVPPHDYGQRAALAFSETFIELGGELASVIPYDPESKDLRKPIKALSGKLAYLGKRKKAGKRRADRDGYITVSGRKKVDFDALFIPDFHPTVAKLLPLLPVGGMQSGSGEGKGKSITLLGMPSWHGVSMRKTEAHAAGALYYDPFGGSHSGGRAEEFVLMFETELGRLPVDIEAEVFDIIQLIGANWRATSRNPSASSTLQKRRDSMIRSLPRPKKPWFGVCGGWAYDHQSGELERELNLFEFDIDGQVMPLD